MQAQEETSGHICELGSVANFHTSMQINSDDSGYQRNSDDSGYQEGSGGNSAVATPGQPKGTSPSTSSGANGSSTLGKQGVRTASVICHVSSVPCPHQPLQSTLDNPFSSPAIFQPKHSASSIIPRTMLPSTTTHTPDPKHHPNPVHQASRCPPATLPGSIMYAQPEQHCSVPQKRKTDQPPEEEHQEAGSVMNLHSSKRIRPYFDPGNNANPGGSEGVIRRVNSVPSQAQSPLQVARSYSPPSPNSTLARALFSPNLSIAIPGITLPLTSTQTPDPQHHHHHHHTHQDSRCPPSTLPSSNTDAQTQHCSGPQKRKTDQPQEEEHQEAGSVANMNSSKQVTSDLDSDYQGDCGSGFSTTANRGGSEGVIRRVSVLSQAESPLQVARSYSLSPLNSTLGRDFFSPPVSSSTPGTMLPLTPPSTCDHHPVHQASGSSLTCPPATLPGSNTDAQPEHCSGPQKRKTDQPPEEEHQEAGSMPNTYSSKQLTSDLDSGYQGDCGGDTANPGSSEDVIRCVNSVSVPSQSESPLQVARTDKTDQPLDEEQQETEHSRSQNNQDVTIDCGTDKHRCQMSQQNEPEAKYVLHNPIIYAPVITGNNVTGGINGPMTVSSSSLSQSPSAGVQDRQDACSSDKMQKIKDAIKSRIKATKELKGTLKAAGDLDEFYMEMHVMGSDFTEVNNNHEIWQVETAHFSNNNIEGSVLKYYEIFKPGDKSFKNVLTKGIAGIGKTITVKKYQRDWSEERHMDHIDFDFVFLLPFRDLNRFKDEERSLLELICFFYPELKGAGSEDIFKEKLLFIFDGLDESQFHVNAAFTTLPDVSTSLSMDVLLTSLMTGKLLPSAHLWITSRPAATGQLPDEVLTQGCVTHIKGFNDHQKEEYFKKKVKDEQKAGQIISHLKLYRSLYIMCHVPLFCWMAFCVLTSCTMDSFAEFPNSLTEMYIHFVITQTCFSYKKYKGSEAPRRSVVLAEHKEMILKLGKLAFQNLERLKIDFSERDFKNCEINVNGSLTIPGFCAELIKMESGLHAENVYCFVHLSVQEFLAALYAFHEFVTNNHTSLGDFKPKSLKKGQVSNLTDFLKAVVAKTNKNDNGQLDLFARFIFGISTDSNMNLLNGFLPDHTSSNREHHKKISQHIKALRSRKLSADRYFNLVHCLIEIGDKDFLKEIKPHETGQAKKSFTPFQCSALAYQLVRSEEKLEVLDLKQYRLTEDCYYRLTPAIPYFSKVLLNCIGISKTFCPTLASALCVPNARLTELDLSMNRLHSGMFLLRKGLCSPNCQIEKLNLSHNSLTSRDVEAFQDVLMSPHSKLKELDLSNNDSVGSDVDVLCRGLSTCSLNVLSLSGCSVDDAGCCSLAKAFQSGQSAIKFLDLTYNNPGKSAQGLFNHLMGNPSSALQDVKMDNGGKCRIKPWLHKYTIDLTFDQNTANGCLNISSIGTKENKKVKRFQTSYPDHPDRFDQCNQVLCSEGLTGRHYWEVVKTSSGVEKTSSEAEKTSSEVYVGVAYKSIERKGAGDSVRLGRNSASWSFFWSDEKSTASHNRMAEDVSVTPSIKLGIFLDWPAGTLTIYNIKGTMKELEKQHHLYTFHTTFQEPVYPAFRIQDPETAIIICDSL